MKHNKFQKKVADQLESQAAFIFNIHGGRWQKSGMPDLEIIHKNWKGWIEIKVEKDEASVIQRIQAAKIELRGMPIYVLRCVEIKYADIGMEDCLGYTYTLENFQGDIIETFNDLKELLVILCRPELNKWNEG